MSATMPVDNLEKTSLNMLLREFFQKLNELIRTQIALVRSEIAIGSRQLAKAFVWGVLALAFGLFALLFLGVSLILLLTPLLGLAWASLVTTVAYLAITGLAAFLARREVGKSSAATDVN
jgi:uncharacterized membrane protein YqjE